LDFFEWKKNVDLVYFLEKRKMGLKFEEIFCEKKFKSVKMQKMLSLNLVWLNLLSSIVEFSSSNW
jgi:hypothetical protein